MIKPDYYKLIKKYNKTVIGHIFISPLRIIRNFVYYHFFPKKIIIKRKFYNVFGYNLNLNNPKTLNEKIQWLKLYNKDKLQTICADKFYVRKYVKELIGEKYLIPLIFHTVNVNNINKSILPDFPVIIKTNHNSSGGTVIWNKEEVDWIKIKKKLRKALKQNYYYKSKEWQYKNIKPRIIVEKLLLNNNQMPNDYKFHCFNGKVEFIGVDIDRFTNHKRNFYSRDWKLLPFTWSEQENGNVLWPTGRDIPKPPQLQEAIDVAEKLSSDFKYVRIDLYFIQELIYFGEITFHHGGGFEIIDPFDWDIKFGNLINI